MIETYFAEIHALHTFTTERWTDGRRGRRLPCAYDQFDDLVFCYCFSRHGGWGCLLVMGWVLGNLRRGLGGVGHRVFHVR